MDTAKSISDSSENAADGGVLNQPQYVVGIGASAGGLEALEQFFDKMPAKTGLAFVVVQHLSPDFRSLMDELLARRTAIPIRRVEDGMAVEPDTVYLIPPKKEMIISGGKLLLTDKDPSQTLTLPIDHFFRSLAQDVGEGAIGIVLSGTGSDGSRGIRAIHDAGGLILVQSAETAKFDGMPKSAVETGVADFVLPVSEMPGTLLHCIHHPAAEGTDRPQVADSVRETAMETIYRLLRDRYGIDFSHYKPNTVARRTERRLLLNQSLDLNDYAKRLEENPDELNLLYKDSADRRDPVFPRSRGIPAAGNRDPSGDLGRDPARRGVPGLGGGLRDGRRGLLAGHPLAGTDRGHAPPREGQDLRHRRPSGVAGICQFGRL